MKPLFEQATLAKTTTIELSSPVQPLVPAGSPPATLVAAPRIRPPSITDEQITALGSDAANALKGVSSELIGHVKSADAGDFGKGLNDLVVLAKGLDPAQMKDRGVLGKLRGLFSSTKERMLSQFTSVEKQIDTLTAQLDSKVALHKRRINDLEQLYQNNFAYHEGLEQGVQACRQYQAQLMTERDAQQAVVVAGSFDAQLLQDYARLLGRLEKRIDDLERAKLMAKQIAPQIRIMQDDARALVNKFGDVQAVTLPAWKNTFSLYVLQLEQKQSVDLLNSIDDTTNAALRKGADLLRENSAAIASSRNRSVVDLATLEHVQAQLLGAIEDVQRIDAEGRARRQAEASKLTAMEDALVKAFAPGAR